MRYLNNYRISMDGALFTWDEHGHQRIVPYDEAVELVKGTNYEHLLLLPEVSSREAIKSRERATYDAEFTLKR